MYRRVRLRLTAWYAAALLLVLLALGAGTYFGLVWALDREVDAGIRARVDEWRTTAPDLDDLRAIDVDDHREDRVDVFLVVFRADGTLVANPAGFDADELLDRGLVRSALGGDETWTTLDEHGRFRLWAAPVREGRRVVGAVIGGRSLEARDESVGVLVAVLGVMAGAGFVLALSTSYVLAGRALEPLRLAHERERAFVGDASHELRSPLTLVRALGESLQRGRLDDDQRQTVDQLIAVTDEASDLVDGLLVLARSDEKPAAGAAVADLASVADEVLARMRPLLDAHGCEVERALEPAPARVAEGDARRVVTALIENVIAHTPRSTRVLVRTRRADASAVLTVADSGPGVPEEQAERIFERFAQVATARTPRAGHGAGLGLAIVAAVARRWGGHAAARRAELGGLEVEVRFPAG